MKNISLCNHIANHNVLFFQKCCERNEDYAQSCQPQRDCVKIDWTRQQLEGDQDAQLPCRSPQRKVSCQAYKEGTGTLQQ